MVPVGSGGFYPAIRSKVPETGNAIETKGRVPGNILYHGRHFTGIAVVIEVPVDGRGVPEKRPRRGLGKDNATALSQSLVGRSFDHTVREDLEKVFAGDDNSRCQFFAVLFQDVGKGTVLGG